MEFNHFDESGKAIMVDVSHKNKTMRTAVASAIVEMPPDVLNCIVEEGSRKGDVFGVARLAGIGAAKRTADLIPLSHPLAIHHVSIDFENDLVQGRITVRAKVRAFERTGVEMEAMVASSLAALTIYDMCKGVDKGICVKEVVLDFKEGGKSGVYRRESSGNKIPPE